MRYYLNRNVARGDILSREGFMNLWMGRHVQLPKNIDSIDKLSINKKKSIDIINCSLDLYDFCHFFEKTEVEPQEGDIFVVQVVLGKYIYGKVIKTDVKLFDHDNKLQSEFVILLYRSVSNTPTKPEYPLELSNLLLKPLLQKNYFFSSGYAKIITNLPLTDEERDIDLGFEFGEYYQDIKGNFLDKAPKYKGFLRVEGLAIAFDIAKILTIDDTVLGNEYIVRVKRKLPLIKTRKDQEINNDIERIIQKMISFQEEIGSYNKNFKKAIQALSKVLYAFLDKIDNHNSENDYVELVSDIVEKINLINDFTENHLIETDEREDICSFIDSVSKNLGYKFSYDITEEKRKW